MSYSAALNELKQKHYVNELFFPRNLCSYEFNEDLLLNKTFIASSQYEVWKAIHHPSQQALAIKRIPLPRNKRILTLNKNGVYITKLRNIKNEIEILRLLRNHDNVVDFYGYAVDSDKVWIFMELMEMTLEDLLLMRKNDSEYTQLEKLNLFYATTSSCLNAFDFFNCHRIVHGDVKPANILINDHCQMKIGDFGLATSMDENNPSLGTMLYASPDRFNAQSKIRSTSDDLWSLGITLLEILYEEHPIIYLSKCKELECSFAILQDYIRNLTPQALLKEIKETKSMTDDAKKLISNFFTKCLFGERDQIALNEIDVYPTERDMYSTQNIDIQKLKDSLMLDFNDWKNIEAISIEKSNNQDPWHNKLIFPDINKKYDFNLHDFESSFDSVVRTSVRVTHIKANKKVFLKYYESIAIDFWDDVNFLSTFNGHPNILEFYGYGKPLLGFYLCTELLELNLDELSQLFEKWQLNFPEIFLRNIIATLIKVLHHIHSKSFRLFIRPKKILFRIDGTIKITNFCYEEQLTNLKQLFGNRNLPVESILCSPFLDDDVNSKNRHLTYRYDIWAFSLSLLIEALIYLDEDLKILKSRKSQLYEIKIELIELQKEFFFVPNDEELSKLKSEKDMSIDAKMFLLSHYSQDLAELLSSCLERDVNKRPDIQALIETEFYGNCSMSFNKDKIKLSEFLKRLLHDFDKKTIRRFCKMDPSKMDAECLEIIGYKYINPENFDF